MRTVLTAGLEPHFYDPRLSDPTASIFNRKLDDIEKYHKTLRRELSFFAQTVKAQEKINFDEELVVCLNGWLGALYAGLAISAPDDLNFEPSENFEVYCWRKLAKSIFFEQERYCWHLIGVAINSKTDTRLRVETDQYMSVDELREDLQSHLPIFIDWLTTCLSSHVSLVDCLNGAVSGRRFYWEIGCKYLIQFVSQENQAIESVSECFPGIVIEYSDDLKIQIKTDAPDPIARLHRLLYRPNSQDVT